ncbi:hypothetical protein HYX11_04625 [Candidatus Woesearchaeota archaeon]|nr:hypothetical protein [Candidatus Woesearchaeota archaeon]
MLSILRQCLGSAVPKPR